MNRTFHYEISKEEGDISIREYLQKRGYSRHILAHVKRTANGILKNGESVPVTVFLHEGDQLDILLEEVPPSGHIPAAAIPFSIIYEDEDLLIVDKPADTPIHPSFNNHENTLANGVVHYYEQLGISFVYRCINRLDRDTSGLLIIAKNMLSGSILSSLIKQRTLSRRKVLPENTPFSGNRDLSVSTPPDPLCGIGIRRTYLAIVEGKIETSGTVTAPIGRKEGSVLERCVDFEKGEYAVTHYQPLLFRKDLNLTLVSLRLETGRTHQIRVHMGYLGHPLIGDYLYHPRRDLISRQALHSWKLEFLHPITKEHLEFQAPLPEDMKFIITPYNPDR